MLLRKGTKGGDGEIVPAIASSFLRRHNFGAALSGIGAGVSLRGIIVLKFRIASGATIGLDPGAIFFSVARHPRRGVL